MIAAARWLAGLPAALRRWADYRRLVTTGPAARVCERNPDRARQRQAIAARQAFLSDLTPQQRVFARPPYGDTN